MPQNQWTFGENFLNTALKLKQMNQQQSQFDKDLSFRENSFKLNNLLGNKQLQQAIVRDENNRANQVRNSENFDDRTDMYREHYDKVDNQPTYRQDGTGKILQFGSEGDFKGAYGNERQISGSGSNTNEDLLIDLGKIDEYLENASNLKSQIKPGLFKSGTKKNYGLFGFDWLKKDEDVLSPGANYINKNTGNQVPYSEDEWNNEFVSPEKNKAIKMLSPKIAEHGLDKAVEFLKSTVGKIDDKGNAITMQRAMADFLSENGENLTETQKQILKRVEKFESL